MTLCVLTPKSPALPSVAILLGEIITAAQKDTHWMHLITSTHSWVQPSPDQQVSNPWWEKRKKYSAPIRINSQLYRQQCRQISKATLNNRSASQRRLQTISVIYKSTHAICMLSEVADTVWPSMSAGSRSTHSTNRGSKIFGKGKSCLYGICMAFCTHYSLSHIV